MIYLFRQLKLTTVKKKLIFRALVVFFGLVVYGSFQLHTLLVDDQATQPCAQVARKNPQVDFNSIYLPCYQNAAHIAPGYQLAQYRLASTLAGLGRYDEARPIFEKLSHSYGSYAKDSRKMLLPGSMQYIKEMDDRLQRNWHTRQALGLTNGAEEREFLRLHAVVRGGRITRMSAANMAIWQEMRERHQKAMDALTGYGKK